MSARTWHPYGEGSGLWRDDELDQGPAIRAYAQPTDDGEAATWEVTAEGPHGAITLASGEAEDLDDARDQAQAALARIVAGGPEAIGPGVVIGAF